MILDWLCPKETHWIHREFGTRLELPGGLEGAAIPGNLEENGRERSHGTVDDTERG
jgi:hypothetical protein